MLYLIWFCGYCVEKRVKTTLRVYVVLYLIRFCGYCVEKLGMALVDAGWNIKKYGLLSTVNYLRYHKTNN